MNEEANKKNNKACDLKFRPASDNMPIPTLEERFQNTTLRPYS